MNTSLLLQQTLNGLAIGSVYAIFALGYTLVFSILRIINFAHGAVFTLGAYFTYLLTGSAISTNGVLATFFTNLFGQPRLPFALPFALALILGAALAGLVSVLCERLAFRPLRLRGADPLLTLVSSLGVAVVLVNLIQYLVGAEAYSYPSNVILAGLPASIDLSTPDQKLVLRTVQIVIFFISLIILAMLTYFI